MMITRCPDQCRHGATWLGAVSIQLIESSWDSYCRLMATVHNPATFDARDIAGPGSAPGGGGHHARRHPGFPRTGKASGHSSPGRGKPPRTGRNRDHTGTRRRNAPSIRRPEPQAVSCGRASLNDLRYRSTPVRADVAGTRMTGTNPPPAPRTAPTAAVGQHGSARGGFEERAPPANAVVCAASPTPPAPTPPACNGMADRLCSRAFLAAFGDFLPHRRARCPGGRLLPARSRMHATL
jgi:hypothetical protein